MKIAPRIGIVILVLLLMGGLFISIRWFPTDNILSKALNSCGSDFNTIYRKFAVNNLPPTFCLNVDTLDIHQVKNWMGNGYCVAFNGHRFGFSEVRVPSIPFELDLAKFSYNYPYPPKPVGLGTCIESFSAYTGKNYCDMIPLYADYSTPKEPKPPNAFFPPETYQPEQYRDRCKTYLAYDLNDISVCEQITRKESKYVCFAHLAKQNSKAEFCSLIPEDAKNNLYEKCLELVVKPER